MFRVRRVLPLAVHTPIPLRTCIGFTRFVLTSRGLAIWTFLHSIILAHLFRHSLVSGLPHNFITWVKVGDIYLGKEKYLMHDPVLTQQYENILEISLNRPEA